MSMAIKYGMNKRKKKYPKSTEDSNKTEDSYDRDSNGKIPYAELNGKPVKVTFRDPAKTKFSDEKMAHGGMCEHGSDNCEMCHGGKMAEGGMIDAQKSGYESMPQSGDKMNMKADEEDDMISRIMAKRMSKGGQVANDTEITADFEPNEFDDLVKSGGPKDFHYTGKNSGDELGNEQKDEDERDLIARIMRSRGKKDRLPNPS